jgi:hypothetical protein
MDYTGQMKKWISLLKESETQQKDTKSELIESQAYSSTVPQKFDTLDAAKQHAKSCLPETKEDTQYTLAETLRARLDRFLSEESDEDPTAKTNIMAQLSHIKGGADGVLKFADGDTVAIDRMVAGTLHSALMSIDKPSVRLATATKLGASKKSFEDTKSELLGTQVNEEAAIVGALAATGPLIMILDRIGAMLFKRATRGKVLKWNPELGKFEETVKVRHKSVKMSDEYDTVAKASVKRKDSTGKWRTTHKSSPTLGNKAKIRDYDIETGEKTTSKVSRYAPEVSDPVDVQLLAKQESQNNNLCLGVTVSVYYDVRIYLYYDGKLFRRWDSYFTMHQDLERLNSDDYIDLTDRVRNVLGNNEIISFDEFGNELNL